MKRYRIQESVVGIIRRYLTALRAFLKKNYRNYYDDRSWWDEVGGDTK